MGENGGRKKKHPLKTGSYTDDDIININTCNAHSADPQLMYINGLLSVCYKANRVSIYYNIIPQYLNTSITSITSITSLPHNVFVCCLLVVCWPLELMCWLFVGRLLTIRAYVLAVRWSFVDHSNLNIIII